MVRNILPVLAIFIVSVQCFSGSDDRFIKKYAMMKIYESCFGPEVVKLIRKEMKAAVMNCAALEVPPPPPSTTTTTTTPAPVQPPLRDTLNAPENTMYANQQSFDAEKLHQAILAFRPQNNYVQPALRPYQGYFPGYQAPPSMYYPSHYTQPMNFAGYPFGFGFGGQQYLGSTRMSREMNLREQLDAITSKINGRVKNVTCVMQELGYLDENLEPNYEKISERIGNLPIEDELKADMQEGVEFCQQFSQCVPEPKRNKSPLSRELIKPMFFFKCYKHKKLEACVMKDVREKFSGVNEDDFEEDVPIRRSGKDMKLNNREIDEMAASMYEFLYGGDTSLDIESVF